MLSSLSPMDVGIYLKDGPFESNLAIVNLHASRETHWLAYVNQSYFVSGGCFAPQNLFKGNTKRIGKYFFSEYKYRVWQVKKVLFALLINYIKLNWQKS